MHTNVQKCLPNMDDISVNEIQITYVNTYSTQKNHTLILNAILDPNFHWKGSTSFQFSVLKVYNLLKVILLVKTIRYI